MTDTTGRRVLIVDDEPNIVWSLEFLMKKEGYTVLTATDGEDALAQMREATPDLVLLDINIPKGNGYEICQAIRTNPTWEGIRVVMLTAKGRDVDREKGIAVGADDYVTKPFSTHEVVALIRRLLGPDG